MQRVERTYLNYWPDTELWYDAVAVVLLGRNISRRNMFPECTKFVQEGTGNARRRARVQTALGGTV